MRAAHRRAAGGLWWVSVLVPLNVEERGGRCVYAASLMPATESTPFWVAAFVPRCECHVVLTSVLSVIGRCFELMWQLWKPAAFPPQFLDCVLCSEVAGCQVSLPCSHANTQTGVDQFLDSGCLGYGWRQGWVEGR